MNLTDEDVREILHLLDSSGTNEFILETEGFKLTLRRGSGCWTREQQTLTQPRIVKGAHAPAGAAADPQTTAAETGARDDGLVNIAAPIVGTFYRAPKPGAAPFVDIGSRVEPNTVIAIIEVMKLMNSIPAGMTGTVAEICIADGEFVERGRTLMRATPDQP
jgi:acetyl-CoA carboxylase biotin carboxyl carrier protein